MIQGADADTVVAALGTLTSVVIGAAFWLRKLKPTFAKDDLATKVAEADMGVIERLEKECKRLSGQNDKLADSLNRFQMEVLKLQTENNKLSMENNALKEENLSLREEIMDLRKEVSELTKMVMEMQRMSPACFGCEHKRR
jgi:chromosome segregation ATPase